MNKKDKKVRVVLLCDEANNLYSLWDDLRFQKNPKANEDEINKAYKAYLDHRETCKDCKYVEP